MRCRRPHRPGVRPLVGRGDAGLAGTVGYRHRCDRARAHEPERVIRPADSLRPVGGGADPGGDPTTTRSTTVMFSHGDRVRWESVGEDGLPMVRYGFVGGEIETDDAVRHARW